MRDLLLERLPSVLLIILILLPNLLFFQFPPKNVPEGKYPSTFKWSVLEKIEWIGRAGVLVIPLFYRFRLDYLCDRISLIGLILSLVFYYVLFARYFMKDRDFRLLFSPLGFIPVPLAIFPLLSFAFSSILMRSIPEMLATLIFAFGHIPISYYEYSKSKL